jgi:hypothetical protein
LEGVSEGGEWEMRRLMWKLKMVTLQTWIQGKEEETK